MQIDQFTLVAGHGGMTKIQCVRLAFAMLVRVDPALLGVYGTWGASVCSWFPGVLAIGATDPYPHLET
jgi:hypothetical protein